MFASQMVQGVEVSRAFPNGDSYKGQWASGVPHGVGRYEWKDGSLYEGDWFKGKKHGTGKFTWVSGALYDGQWHQGKMQGLGRFRGPDNSVYVGIFVADVKQGLGTKKYASGDVYTGFWKGGAAEGEGTYVWANGNGYGGAWVRGLMCGVGNFLWANGDKYEGEWLDGCEHGQGRFTWADGSCFEGTWSQGLKDGRGIYYPAGYRKQPLASSPLGGVTATDLGGQAERDLMAIESGRVVDELEAKMRSTSRESVEDSVSAPNMITGEEEHATREGQARGIQQFRDLVKRVTDEMDSKLKNLDSLWISRVAPTTESHEESFPEVSSSGGQGSEGMKKLIATIGQVLAVQANAHGNLVAEGKGKGKDYVDEKNDGNEGVQLSGENILSGKPASLHLDDSASLSHSDSETSTPRAGSLPGAPPGFPADSLNPGLTSEDARTPTQSPRHTKLAWIDRARGIIHNKGGTSKNEETNGSLEDNVNDCDNIGEHPSVEPGKLSTLPEGSEAVTESEKNPQFVNSVGDGHYSSSGSKKPFGSSVSDIGRRISVGRGSQEVPEPRLFLHDPVLGLQSGTPSASIDEDVPVEREYVQGVLISERAIKSTVSMPRVRLQTQGKKSGVTIFKGHQSYDLMLTLQLGIRYAVGKMTADTMRDIYESDFSPKSSMVRFPSEGTQQTPSHSMQPFRWKDFCPHVFRHLRSMFGIDPVDYMLSLCGDDALREMSSPGKSGSVFFLSHDDRFIIKTMRKSEVTALLRMLPAYYQHVQTEENTIITKFFGLHQVKIHLGSKVRFVVMGNLLQSNHRVHRRFDLKGSSQGRSTNTIDIDETTTLKDLDLDLLFYLPARDRTLLQNQIHKDCQFLEEQGIMDYSLLLGLHFKASHKPPPFVTISDNPTGSKDLSISSLTNNGISKTTFPSFDEKLLPSLEATMQDESRERNSQSAPVLPKKEMRRGRSIQSLSLQSTQGTLGQGMEATAVRPDKLVRTPIIDPELAEAYPVVLYFGIIDILQEYDSWKRVEHYVKKLQYDSNSISSISPKLYAKRFQEFILSTFPEGREREREH